MAVKMTAWGVGGKRLGPHVFQATNADPRLFYGDGVLLARRGGLVWS